VFGLTDYVIVIVVNALVEGRKPTNHFDKAATIRIAALNSIYQDTIGNQHARSDIQKQAYPSSDVKTIRNAYGLTGTNYETHSPFINGLRVELDDEIVKNTEIVLVKHGLNVKAATMAANRHRIIPDRTGN
jgi:hypothetical protein